MNPRHFRNRLALTLLIHINLLSSTVFSQEQPIPGVFATGVDMDGNALAPGDLEQNYSLSGPAAPAFVIRRHGAWISPPPFSMWIGISGGASDAPDGAYIYSLTFDLSGFIPATAKITGSLAADDGAEVFLNGSKVESFGFPFWVLDPVEITDGFLGGLNTLEIVVTNLPAGGANPSGLLFADVIATAIALGSPVLSVDDLVAGGTSTGRVTGATPFGNVGFAYSTNGAGPTMVASGSCGILTVDLSPPIRVLPIQVANEMGEASISMSLPVSGAGVQVWIQALDVGTCALTNSVIDTIL
jgi:hypothetical protein